MVSTKGLAQYLGMFNGIIAGLVIGVGAYVKMTTGAITLPDLLASVWDVGGYAVGASTATSVTSRVTEYPTGIVLAGALGGFVGAGIAVYAPLVTSIPITSNIIQQIITGLIAGGVIGLFTRFLPGL